MMDAIWRPWSESQIGILNGTIVWTEGNSNNTVVAEWISNNPNLALFVGEFVVMIGMLLGEIYDNCGWTGLGEVATLIGEAAIGQPSPSRLVDIINCITPSFT